MVLFLYDTEKTELSPFSALIPQFAGQKFKFSSISSSTITKAAALRLCRNYGRDF